MEEHFFPLTHFCQGTFGFVDVPEYIVKTYRIARAKRIPEQGVKPNWPSYKEWLIQRGWARERLNELDRAQRLFFPKMYATIFAANISVYRKGCLAPSDAKVTLLEPIESHWRPAGYGFASFFWEFFFHEKNIFLEDPELLFDDVRRRMGSIEDRGPNSWFALAIQMCGILDDIAMERQHYLDNIVQRKSLNLAEQAKRVTLFTQAAEYLHNHTLTWTFSAAK